MTAPATTPVAAMGIGADIDPEAQRRLRRTAVLLISLFDVLVLAVGAVASFDLRRLATPAGAAEAAVESAATGDCDRFLGLLSGEARAVVLSPVSSGPGTSTQSPRQRACNARLRPLLQVTGARLIGQRGDRATTEVTVRGRPVGTMLMVHEGGHWRLAGPSVAVLDGLLGPAAP